MNCRTANFLLLLSVLIVCGLFQNVSGFQRSYFPLSQNSRKCQSTLTISSQKGFGKPEPKKKSKKQQNSQKEILPQVNEVDDTQALFQDAEDRARARLREMEAREEAKRNEQLEKIRALQEEERAIRDQPDAGVIPEVVSNRMLGRIIPFIAFPVFMGIGLFYFFIVLARQYEISVEPSLVAYATQAPFAVGLAGITYGVLSASWDPEIEGSLLGIEEFKTNLQRIFDGLQRTKDKQVLKDQINASNDLANRNRAQRRMAQKTSDEFDDLS